MVCFLGLEGLQFGRGQFGTAFGVALHNSFQDARAGHFRGYQAGRLASRKELINFGRVLVEVM